MSHERRVGPGILSGVLVLAAVLLAAATSTAQDMAAEVERIVAQAQTKSGEHADALSRLGTAAVPTLIAALDTCEHPLVVVEALGRIGDRRASLPLLRLLESRRPFAAPDEAVGTEILIAALREIGDPSAEPLLLGILTSEPAASRARLAAATALARLGSPAARREARAFILQVEVRPSGSLSVAALDRALLEAGTPESRTRLLRRLSESPLAHEKAAIVDLLAARRDPWARGALLRFCESPREDPYLRLHAARALLDKGRAADRARVLRALEEIRGHLAPELEASVEDLS